MTNWDAVEAAEESERIAHIAEKERKQNEALVSELHKLIEQWRVRADWADTNENYGYAFGLEDCADELEEAIQSATGGGPDDE